MTRIPSNSYDWIIADIVYGIDGNSHRNNRSRGKLSPSKDYHDALWNQSQTGSEYFDLAFFTSKNQMFFGANYIGDRFCKGWFKPPRVHEFDHFLDENPIGWILWDKVNYGSSFSDCELVWTSTKKPSVRFPFMWNGMMQGKSISEGYIMQGNKSLNEERIHPTQKPVKLYQWIFQNYVNSSETILDTHLGSGSSMIAAESMKLKFVGLEIDEVYYKDCLSRIKEYIRIENSMLRIPFNEL